jgi:integrase/recombinase XerD
VLVVRVVSPVSSRESWTVFGDDDRPVEPVERYLAYLTGIERSPNTIKAYAHDLKDWFEFLADRETNWRAVRLEDVGAFVSWLRSPPEARDARVAVLPSVTPACGESTVNRKLSALGSLPMPPATASTSPSCWHRGRSAGHREGGSRFCITSASRCRSGGGRCR